MADVIAWCDGCGGNTPQMEVQESRTRICSQCGGETRFPKGYKIGIDKRETKRKIKKENNMPKPKLTRENLADIKQMIADGLAAKEISHRIKASYSVVNRIINGIYPKRFAPSIGEAPDKKCKPAKAKRTPATDIDSPCGGFKYKLNMMVAEAVDRRLAGIGIDTLEAKIEEVVLRLLK